MAHSSSIVWFRRDLRLMDNPAFSQAKERGSIMPIYILDDTVPKSFSMGGASRWWLHHSLCSLSASLKHHLNFYRGSPQEILVKLVKQHNIDAVFMNRCFEPWQDRADARIIRELAKENVQVNISNASMLWQPEDITKGDGSPYKVFTAFYNHVLRYKKKLPCPLMKPTRLKLIKDPILSFPLESLELIPRIPWYQSLEKTWRIGERAAQDQLSYFLQKKLRNYKEKRDFPGHNNVSRLSPHLHFGEISPLQIWHAIPNKEHPFLREIIWREFSYYLLCYFPTLPTKNMVAKFDNLPWQYNRILLKAWQQGKTGYPLVDAGMRELWQTGYMHNRVRMVVASFLVKNLLIGWRQGAQWFLDCLVDADLAINSTNWQWVAGCGVDPSPFFRIFNPTTQGEKYDGDGDYTRRYVPELKKLPNKYLFKPWQAPIDVLKEAGVLLGKTYPYPVIDFIISRERALEAFRSLNR